MAVMGSDNIVGVKGPLIRKSPQTIIGRPAAPVSKKRFRKPTAPRSDRNVVCGEMSQQCGHSGAQSTPQTFLQLVGYRDPNAGSVKR
jgi:hypothetical protein